MDSAKENPAEFNYEQHRKKLFLRLGDELEKIERLMPIKPLADNVEYPQWVKNVGREILLVMCPAAKLRKGIDEITPKRMGSMLGHFCEIAVWTSEESGRCEDQVDTSKEKKISEDDCKQAQKFRADFSCWYDSCRRLAKRSLCSCVDLNYQDMADFLLGFADAFSRKPQPYKRGNLGSTTFEIYYFMLVNWSLIETLQSVREFHELLVRIFGVSSIGDQKRTEKICQRMGLHFRKPGRPAKN